MAVPGWKIALEKALGKHPNAVVFQLASCTPSSPPLPHVRSHIFRAFLAPADAPGLPLLLTTTDIRSLKLTQIVQNPSVELAWWIEGTQEQFRITGRAYVVTASGTGFQDYIKQRTVGMQGPAMLALGKEGFDWEVKRVEVFKSLSGYMKATWCRPLPGSQLKDLDEPSKWPEKIREPREGDEDECVKQNWERALNYFGLVTIEPAEVDYLELGVYPNRRTRFWRNESTRSWNSELLVP